jgi:hypothetical protein
MTNANPLTTVSLMLTLAGLVGTFFNIQLSQWLRDLLALEQKAELNRPQGNDAQQRAIVECQVELRRLVSTQTYAVTAVVVAFVVFVLVDALFMATWGQSDPIYPYVNTALCVFLVLFVVGSAWLTYQGWSTAKRAKVNFVPPAQPDAQRGS